MDPYIAGMAQDNVLVGVLLSAAAGCAGSKLGGGKCTEGAWNAAVQGAFIYLFNAAVHDQMAGTTRVEIQGNIAAESAGVGYLFSPDALHLSITIYDAYAGITTLDGQPRACAAIVCVNKQIQPGKRSGIIWGPYRLDPPSSMSDAAFGNQLNLRAQAYVDGRVPYRYPAPTSNTWVSDLIRGVGGRPPQFDFGRFQAPGYNTHFMIRGN